MGNAPILAIVALVIFASVLMLLYCWSRSQESVSVKEYARIMNFGQAQDSNAGGTSAAPAFNGRMPPRPKWQYKYKPVSRYNAQLGRTEQVMALVLVYE